MADLARVIAPCVVALWAAGRSDAVRLIGLQPVASPPGVYATGPTHVLAIETSPFSVTTIGTVPGEMLSGLDQQPGTGQVFASSGNNGANPGSLFLINSVTGAATLLGPIGLAAVPSIVFDADGTLFASGWDGLLTLDPATGASFIGGLFGQSGGLTILGIDAIEIDPLTGILYGVSNTQFDGTPGDVFVINKLTGAATRLGELRSAGALLPKTLAGLAFDGSGSLYGSLGGGDGRIISIDLNTLTYSFLGDAAEGAISALPEPGATTLLGAGLVGLFGIERLHRRRLVQRPPA